MPDTDAAAAPDEAVPDAPVRSAAIKYRKYHLGKHGPIRALPA